MCGSLGVIARASVISLALLANSPSGDVDNPNVQRQIVRQPIVEYPQHSRRLDEEGVVGVSISINAAGKVTSCSVLNSSGFIRLDEATCKAVKSMRYEPLGRNATSPSSTQTNVRLRWTLDGEIDDKVDPLDGSLYPVGIPHASRGINLTEPGELRVGERVNVGLYVGVAVDGSVTSCKVQWGSGRRQIDERACQTVFSYWRYDPAKEDSEPVVRTAIETFFYADPSAAIPTSK